MSIAFFWFFVMLLALGTPVVFALLIGPGLGLVLDDQRQYFPALLSRFYNGVDSFPLLAVPFFILAGELMNAGGITRSIVNFSLSLVGHVRGGLAQVNILSSMLFAGISGSVTEESHSNCASDGAIGCITVAGYKSADMAIAIAGNIKTGAIDESERWNVGVSPIDGQAPLL